MLTSIAPLLFCLACRDLATLDTRVPVGKLSLHIMCQGKGAPSVVLDAGLGNDARAWSKVQPEVAKFTRVCVYDRAGLGSSSPAPRPHTNRQMASELQGLLTGAKIPAPYVLVGHSMGGTNVQLLLANDSSSVAGMVLVDASPKPPPFDEMPPAQLAEFESNIERLEGLDLKTMRAGFTELEASNRTLGKKPLVILVAGKSAPEPFLDETRAQELFDSRQQAQKSLTKLSRNHLLITVRDSSHHIPMDSPGAVVAAIRAVVESARSGAALREPGTLGRPE